MKTWLLSSILAILCISMHAQSSITPSGYELLQSVKADFDEDGKTDLFCILKKSAESEDFYFMMAALDEGKITILSPSLSSSYHPPPPKSIQKNVIDVNIVLDSFEFHSHLKFRWDKNAADFQLIGYDMDKVPLPHRDPLPYADPPYEASLNLLTGEYKSYGFFKENKPYDFNQKEPARPTKLVQKWKIKTDPLYLKSCPYSIYYAISQICDYYQDLGVQAEWDLMFN